MPNIFFTSFKTFNSNYGVIFCNFEVNSTQGNIILPDSKNQPSKLYFLNLFTQDFEVNQEFVCNDNQELIIVNLILSENNFDNIKNCTLNQKIIVNNPSCVVRHITLGIQSNESNWNLIPRVYIESRADNSNILQLIKVIKLDPKSKLNCNPILQINCPEVVAKHGVANSNFDSDSINLLSSRGFNNIQIKKILSRAFLEENLGFLELCVKNALLKELGI